MAEPRITNLADCVWLERGCKWFRTGSKLSVEQFVPVLLDQVLLEAETKSTVNPKP